MLEALSRLMDEGDYHGCLEMADRYVMKGGWTPFETASIHLTICRCRLSTQNPHGAVVAGTLAVKLAREAEAHDLLGRALLNLGTAYVGVQKFDQALRQFYRYFDYATHYQEARRFEGAIWKHIGITHQRKLESTEAVTALTRAREWFDRHKIDWSTFTSTHDLINTYLQIAETDSRSHLDDVKILLKKQNEIVRRHARESYFHGTYLLDLAACYRLEGRIARAKVSATRALEVHQGDRLHMFHCHYLLHRCGLDQRDVRYALGHALAAKVQAVEGRYLELEELASRAMAEVIRQEGSEIVRQLDEEYQAVGVDLGEYLQQWVVRRDLQ